MIYRISRAGNKTRGAPDGTLTYELMPPAKGLKVPKAAPWFAVESLGKEAAEGRKKGSLEVRLNSRDDAAFRYA